MNPEAFMLALVSATGKQDAVEKIPGAFLRREVIRNCANAKEVLFEIKLLGPTEQASLIKSLAIYEQTVGGLGSATFLSKALPIIDDPKHHVFDWVLKNSNSYEYFAQGAKSYSEMQERGSKRRDIAKANMLIEEKRAEEARQRRAVKATNNLLNAIKRSDTEAVRSLIKKGANLNVVLSNGLSAADFAKEIGHSEVFQLIQDWRDND